MLINNVLEINQQTLKYFRQNFLYKNKNKLEVAIEGTTIKIILKKNNPLDKYYLGRLSNMDFQSTGE